MRVSILIHGVLLCLGAFPLNAGSSDYGITGLIDMPSARMGDDATFSVVYSRQDVADTYSLNYQALPWLEASFRYNIQDARLDRSDGDGLRDRSYGLKLKLTKERAYTPEIAVGIQDLFGTGIYASEYVVASKEVIQNLDFTLGLGWGRLAGRNTISNPLTEISSVFTERNADFNTGRPNLKDYFSGANAGIFGGIEYKVLGDSLAFLAEYNSDAYTREVNFGSVDLNSPWSFGVNWRPSKQFELGVSWQHGSQLGIRVAASSLSNAKNVKRPHTVPKYRLGLLADDNDALKADLWYEKLKLDMDGSGVRIRAAKLNKTETKAFIEFENRGYMLTAEAMADVAKSAFRYLPTSVDELSLTVYETGTFPVTVDISRALMASGYLHKGDLPFLHRNIAIRPGNKLQGADYYAKSEFGKLVLSADIANSVSLFDPDVPLLYQLYADVGVSLRLWDDWRLRGGIRLDIDNNYDESTRISDSALPRVRSDSILYLQQGTNSLNQLYVDKFGKLAPSTYYRAFGGILESMFAGVGAEVLHQPYRSRFAFGANAIAVKQRDFDQRFGFQDYQTIIGHVSVYWATPFYNYDAAVHVGRYLAKDVGATFELSRRFSNGWRIGLFATLTDVPFDEFGEGSFDKGFIIQIPLESMFATKSRGTYRTEIRPVGRDGGARLGGFSASLWDKIRSTNYDSIYDNLGEFVE